MDLNESVTPLGLNDEELSPGSHNISRAILRDLPVRVPEDQLTPQEAKILKYEKKMDLKKTFKFIDTNESMFNFSTSNIGYPYLSNIWGLRLEGFILRVRIIIYTTLIVSLTSFPLFCSLLIFSLEISHISLFIYYALKYKYSKNWLLLASKINIGISIIAITLVGIS